MGKSTSLDQYAEERKLRRKQIAYQRETLGELQTVLGELVKTAHAVAIEKRELFEKATPEEIKGDDTQTAEAEPPTESDSTR